MDLNLEMAGLVMISGMSDSYPSLCAEVNTYIPIKGIYSSLFCGGLECKPINQSRKMERNRRIILLSEGVIFISPTDFFSLNQTTFPQGSLRIKNVRMHPHWEVECTQVGDLITMEVVDYDASSTIDFYQGQGFKDSSQKERYTVAFKNLDWPELQRRLSSHTLAKLKPFLNPESVTPAVEKKESKPDVTLPEKEKTTNSRVYDPPEVKHEYDIEVAYKDAKFNDGFVAFTRTLPCHYDPIQFKIHNSVVLSQFDSVKDYFSKAINNRKKIDVKVIVYMRGYQLLSYSATSIHIDKIDDGLIEGIAKERIKKLTSPRSNKRGKSILTADELLQAVPSDLDVVFKHTGVNILNSLIEIRNVRNRLQLEYLSGTKQSAKEKLRFTLNPNFGFLFFVEGEKNNYFCWELLESHATYVWTFNKAAKNPFSRIDSIIRTIQEIGRQQYKSSHNSGEVDADLTFDYIHHSDTNSSETDSFSNWKQQVDAIFA